MTASTTRASSRTRYRSRQRRIRASRSTARRRGTSPAGRGFDNATNLVSLTTFARTDPTPMLSGLDARLIEAEAALNTNNVAGMMTILNNLRTNPQNLGTISTPAMATLATPASQTAAVDLFFREKAFWTLLAWSATGRSASPDSPLRPHPGQRVPQRHVLQRWLLRPGRELPGHGRRAEQSDLHRLYGS